MLSRGSGHHPGVGQPPGGPRLLRGAVPGRPGSTHTELHLHQLHQHRRPQTLQEPVFHSCGKKSKRRNTVQFWVPGLLF